MLWARVPWLGQLRRSSLLGKPLLSEDKGYEPFSDSPGVLTESGPKLGEDRVQLASPSGYDGLLAKFANSIVESPRRHACTSWNFMHGSVVCAIPHILYFRGKKSAASGVGEDKANMPGSVAMARRRGRDEPPVSSGLFY